MGIVSDRDLKRLTPSLASGVAQVEFDAVLAMVTVRRAMTPRPLTVMPSTPLREVAAAGTAAYGAGAICCGAVFGSGGS